MGKNHNLKSQYTERKNTNQGEAEKTASPFSVQNAKKIFFKTGQKT
jgi:hypothetical protein